MTKRGIDYFKAEDGTYYRFCPKCNSKLIYTSYTNAWSASNVNSVCCSCHQKGELNHQYGKPSPNRGHKNTAEYRMKMSERLSGENNPRFGKRWDEDWKLKMRQWNLNRLDSLGISSKTDVGAKEWFEDYNKKHKFNFQPTRFLEIGYDADGYDPSLHAWIEYDTAYHYRPSQFNKDVERENRITRYFEQKNNPLLFFGRVNYKTSKMEFVY